MWLFERMLYFIFTVVHVHWWLYVYSGSVCNECLQNILSFIMIWHDNGPFQNKPRNGLTSWHAAHLLEYYQRYIHSQGSSVSVTWISTSLASCPILGQQGTEKPSSLLFFKHSKWECTLNAVNSELSINSTELKKNKTSKMFLSLQSIYYLFMSYPFYTWKKSKKHFASDIFIFSETIFFSLNSFYALIEFPEYLAPLFISIYSRGWKLYNCMGIIPCLLFVTIRYW